MLRGQSTKQVAGKPETCSVSVSDSWPAVLAAILLVVIFLAPMFLAPMFLAPMFLAPMFLAPMG
jgi:hypothetical protein